MKIIGISFVVPYNDVVNVGKSKSVSVSGNHAYVADEASGLQILNISKPSRPALKGSHKTPGMIESICITDTYAFIATGTSGLQIINITRPSNPVLTGSCDTPGSAVDIAVAGGFAFVADETSGLQIVDIRKPADPAIVGSGQFPDSVSTGDSLFLDTDIVQRWVDGTNANNGLLIMSEFANHMAVYGSDETSYVPVLKVVFEVESVLDSININASEAMSILQTTFQPPSDRLVIGAGLGYGSFFDFDADTIRKNFGENTTINKAVVTFHVDTMLSIQSKDQTFEI